VTHPQITVVVPTHNRRDSLVRLLDSLRDGTYPAAGFEVIVVADGCVDDTVSQLTGLTSRDGSPGPAYPFALRVIEQSPAGGAALARTRGAEHARGAILLFIDDDIEPFPTLLEHHARLHAAQEHGVVIGAPVPVRPVDAALDRISAWGWWEQQFEAMSRPGHRFTYDEVFSGILSVRTDDFREIGGFDPAFNSCRDDSEFGYRLFRRAARVAFVREAGGFHHEVRDHPRLVSRKRAEGRADVLLAERHPELWPVLRISWPLPPVTSPLGLLRRLAFAAPRVGHAAAALLLGLLPVVARLRLRGTWRQIEAGAMYYNYWRGVAAQVGTIQAFEHIATNATTAAARVRDDAERGAPEIDLALGLTAAEQVVEASRPLALRVRHGHRSVGLVRYAPGAERLRAVHLRGVLATELPTQIAAALDLARGDAPEVVADDPRAVSVIMPAFNAAATIARAIDSVLAQTVSHWQLVVTDDGSTDTTAQVVQAYAARDPRIVLVRQGNHGPGPARNLALAHARHPWVLCLDADDWLAANALASLAAAVAGAPDVDAVHGGWALVGHAGTLIEEGRCSSTGDLFPVLARRAAFPIHACMVRRECIEAVGGFSADQLEDWQLWQRIARRGARFAHWPGTIAFYQQRPDSRSADASALCAAAMQRIAEAHTGAGVPSDWRHASGRPAHEEQGARLAYLMWVVGTCVAEGADPTPLLSHIAPDSADIDAGPAADTIVRALRVSHARSGTRAATLSAHEISRLGNFADALEAHLAALGLASALRNAVHSRVVPWLIAPGAPSSATLGATHGERVEITSPITDVRVPSGAERLVILPTIAGEPLEPIDLPAFDAVVPQLVVRDAIADRHAWRILGRFLEPLVYDRCDWRTDQEDVSAWLDGRCLARGLPQADAEHRAALHDVAGWALFLDATRSEGDDRRDTTSAAADGVSRAVAATVTDRGVAHAGDDWVEVELLNGVPVLPPPSRDCTVALTLCGAGVSVFSLRPEDTSTAEVMRQRLTDLAGFELCRVAVRETLIGAPWAGATSLSAHLRAALARASHTPGDIESRHVRLVPDDAIVATHWTTTAARHLAVTSSGAVVARRPHGVVGTSASRITTFPTSLRQVVIDQAHRAGTPVVEIGAGASGTQQVSYAPDLLWHHRSVPAGPRRKDLPLSSEGNAAERLATTRHDFEALFASGADPWQYDSPYEARKYEQTLALLPPGRLGRALELACAEGHFTVRLAARVDTLVATDISEIAATRARERCRHLANVDVRRLDLVHDALDGPYDLIVCSEVLYYVGDRTALEKAIARMVAALGPSGYLLTAHAHVLADDPDRTGYDWDVPFGARTISEVCARTAPLSLVREFRTPLYRISLFQANATAPPEVIESDDFVLPAPERAAHIACGGRRGGHASVGSAADITLPILMYHRIAPEGPERRRRQRVTPDAFEAQLGYLRDCGFTSISLDQWQRYTARLGSLPTRPVLLTFDDGFADFAEHAYPRLRRFGFGALVMLVTGSVGRWNTWDSGGASERLLDWDDVRRLAAEGIQFGAHSETHPRLTGLPPTHQFREAIAAGTAVRDALGSPADAFAYPYGDEDAVTRHIVGAAGFTFGLTTEMRRAARWDSLLALPRIEVSGLATLDEFIASLAS
jgi:glycosyltransferase involved in cell wall biosynthesis/peptidoglycan/xylan/chitin deacetylase (PgdA/CDA1 family)